MKVRPLTGKTALITGSTSGLGLAVAMGLAEAGCGVMLNGVEPSDEFADTSSNLAESTNSPVFYQQADLSTREGVELLLDATLKRFDKIDVLVNNAVVRHFASIVDLAPEHWDSALAVNLSAAFHAIRLVLPGMRSRNYGRIFNMVSVYGFRGTPNRVGYVTTKSALVGLTRTVALENMDYDVTCHSICPGSVLTPGTDMRIRQLMQERSIDRNAAEHVFLEGKQPGGRFVSPESISSLIAFMCSPVARDMSGAILPVEGGWLAS